MPSTEKHRSLSNYNLEVSSRDGYMMTITVEAQWSSVAPEVLFALFAPSGKNATFFRDVKATSVMKVMHLPRGVRITEINQLGELKIMKVKHEYSTSMKITEYSRDPCTLVIEFNLLQSDVLSKFNGSWVFTSMNGTQGCRGVLTQSVLPKGIIPAMAKLPLIGRILRGISVRTIKRLMEDTNAAVRQIEEIMSSGTSLHEAMSILSSDNETKHHKEAPADFSSFPIELDNDIDDEN